MRMSAVGMVGWMLVAGGMAPALGQEMTLETLRQRVARNEALINPIKLSYTITKSRTGEQLQSGGGRRSGRSYSHSHVSWAQSLPQQYVHVEWFYGPNDLARSEWIVFDDKSTNCQSKPTVVYMGPVRDTDWWQTPTSQLGLRPFEDRRLLSELLVRPFATLDPEPQCIKGRLARVVDIICPERSPTVGRFWIDAEAAIPLRGQIYEGHPAVPESRLVREVNDVTPYRLPNGGWFPIAGVRSIHFSDWTPSDHHCVDVNSITIQPKDIPDSLFQINLSHDATICNASIGMTTHRGQPVKTYEQIVNGPDPYIAGAVMDREGNPVDGVAVTRLCIETVTGSGRPGLGKLVQPYEQVSVRTDAEGRFAMEAQERSPHVLAFYHSHFADKRVSHVPYDQHDLKVVLDRGGTVRGRAFFVADGHKVPLSRVAIVAKAGDRLFDMRMRPVRKETTTDELGRFQLPCLPTQMRDPSNSSQPVAMPWEIRCGSASTSVTFQRDGDNQEIELLLKPDVRSAPPLLGRPLPGLDGLGLDVDAADMAGRRVLVCFFDMKQRPARRCVLDLAKQAAWLKEKDIVTLVVHEAGIDRAELKTWAEESGVECPIGIISVDPEEVKFTWAARSLPWLVLTDGKHVVTAEGFGVSELRGRIE